MPRSISEILLCKDRLGQHHVNASYAVDDLGHPHIYCDACKHVRLIEGQSAGGYKVFDHVARSAAGRFVEAFVKSHGDDVCGSLGARVEQMHIFADRETEHTDQRRFHSSEIHFAVAHREVSVANIQQSLRALYRNKHRRAGDELLVVHVARVISGRRTVNPSGRRRHPNAAEKRLGRKMDARRELEHFSGEIEFDQLLPRVRELVTEQSVRRPEVIKAVRGARLDIDKIHLQDVARHGAFHTDWSKQDMWSGSTIFHFGMTCSTTDGWTESSPVNGPLCAAISTSAIPIPVAKIVRMIRFATRLSLWIMAIVTKVRPPCSSRAVHFTQFTEEPLKMMRWRRASSAAWSDPTISR